MAHRVHCSKQETFCFINHIKQQSLEDFGCLFLEKQTAKVKKERNNTIKRLASNLIFHFSRHVTFHISKFKDTKRGKMFRCVTLSSDG